MLRLALSRVSDTSVVSSAIKFQEVLNRLVGESPFKSNRKPIWESLNITSAALSQYLQGQARPRLEVLVALADFFGVSLDYLVLGREQTATTDHTATVTRFVDSAISDIQGRTASQAWMVGRIGQILAAYVDEAAKVAVAENSVPGSVGEDEVVMLERCSRQTKVVTSYLDCDIQHADGVALPGRFAWLVAENLMRDPVSPYQFMVARPHDNESDVLVHAYRRMLSEMGVPADRLKSCQFKVVPIPVFNSSVFFHLDLDKLRRMDALLFEMVQPHITPIGVIGLTLHPHGVGGGHFVHSVESLTHAMSTFDHLWHSHD